VIKDSSELDKIIKEKSVLFNDEEVKKASNEEYPILLNR
jgi:hypothetical protein